MGPPCRLKPVLRTKTGRLLPPHSDLVLPQRLVPQVGRRGSADTRLRRTVRPISVANTVDPVLQVQQLPIGSVVEVAPAVSLPEDQLLRLPLRPRLRVQFVTAAVDV